MPVILLCCTVGSFAVAGNNPFAVVLVAVFGVLGYAMEANGFPVGHWCLAW
jgi:TctA family transporter